MLKNMKVGTRLIAGFLLISLVTVIVGAIGIRNMSKINEKTAALYHTELRGVSHTKEANINLIYIGRTIGNMLLTTEPVQRGRYAAFLKSAERELLKNVAQAKPLFCTKDGKQQFADFEGKLAAYLNSVHSVVHQAVEQNLDSSHADMESSSRTFGVKAAQLDGMISALSRMKEANAEAAYEETLNLFHQGRLYMSLLIAGGMLASLGLGVLITRSITRPLAQAVDIAHAVAAGDLSTHFGHYANDELGQLLRSLKEMNKGLIKIVREVRSGTEEISMASSQIAAGSLNLSARTEQQATTLGQAAASMDELTSTVKQNANNAQQANQLVVAASVVAEKGGAVITEVVTTMESINASSRKIVDIIGVIDGIAFQTNILALNAAVEATRAGPQGRGFAIVAGEVRMLAQRSAAAAKEIKELVLASVDKVGTGREIVGRAGSTISEMVDSVMQVSDIVEEITAAGQAQVVGIEQINQAVNCLDEVTQKNAALAEQAAAAAGSLLDQAVSLKETVGAFRLGSGATTIRAASQVPMEQPVSVVRWALEVD